MITAQEARALKSDRYEDVVNAIDKEIRSATKKGQEHTYYYAPYDEDVEIALRGHGFAVSHTSDQRDGDCWYVSWS